MTGVRETAKVYTLSVRTEGADHGGPIADQVADPDGLATAMFRHLVVFVHGFNNTACEALKSYKAFRGNLEGAFDKSDDNLSSRLAPDALGYFQWPGDYAMWFWRQPVMDAVGYPIDVERALASAALMAGFLGGLLGSPPRAAQISFVGHSLGCRLILEALKAWNAGHEIQVASFMAAAVPVALVDTGGELLGAANEPRTALKLYSFDDTVLRLAFPAGQAAAFAAGIESAPYGEAVGLNGNPNTFGNPIQTKNGHGDYWGDPNSAADFATAVDPSVPPPPNTNAVAARRLPPAATLSARQIPSRRLSS